MSKKKAIKRAQRNGSTPKHGTASRRTVTRIAHVSREYEGLAGAGGIKDVTEGLCKASAAAGIDTHVFLPFYRSIDGAKDLPMEEWLRFDVPMNYAWTARPEAVTIWTVPLEPKLRAHLVQAERFRYILEGPDPIERHGIYQYTREEAIALGRPELEGKGYFDFFAMNVLLVKATLKALGEIKDKPDIVHCHDGHTALLPVIAQASYEGFEPILAYLPSVVTIHNAGRGYHQEIDDLDFAAAICGLPREVIDGCLLNGKFDPLVAAGLYCQGMNTVSENYAYELQHTGRDAATGWLGHTLADRGTHLEGITNGVDPEAFDPTDPDRLGLAAAFSPRDGELLGKEVCKKSLLEALSRDESRPKIVVHGRVAYKRDTPLLTFISRLEAQKGIDILAEAVEDLFQQEDNVHILGLGTGKPEIESRFKELAERFNGRVCLAVGYDPGLAVKIYAAGDFFLIPSRYEPCGLTDFYAQLLGNVPIVHRVGGLVKTIDGQFGFAYLGGKAELIDAIKRALFLYHQKGRPALRKIQVNAAVNIYENFTWAKILEKKYLPFYREATARTKPILPY